LGGGYGRGGYGGGFGPGYGFGGGFGNDFGWGGCAPGYETEVIEQDDVIIDDGGGGYDGFDAFDNGL
jgi:hypothetical protein